MKKHVVKLIKKYPIDPQKTGSKRFRLNWPDVVNGLKHSVGASWGVVCVAASEALGRNESVVVMFLREHIGLSAVASIFIMVLALQFFRNNTPYANQAPAAGGAALIPNPTPTQLPPQLPPPGPPGPPPQ